MESSFEFINHAVFPWHCNARWYLDDQTADVFFTFNVEEDEVVKIAAHKFVLATVSPVFHAMFYGPLKQEGDIPIVDSTAEEFKEFLQFFYLSEVNLTSENVAKVMGLCKQYMLDQCIKLYADVLKMTLTLSKMCWGYEWAILFEQNDLRKFCEDKISHNASVIFQTSGFLECDQNLLRHILQIDSLGCDEPVVFKGCMEWAMAACVRKGLDAINMQNLRSQLGELFYEIRFGDMTLETVYTFHREYKGLFATDEFEDIIGMLTSREFRPKKFNRRSRTRISNDQHDFRKIYIGEEDNEW